MQKNFIHLIMDYAPGDLALSEVVSALSAQIKSDVQWHTTSVASFDTVSTGFVVGQLSLVPAAEETVLYVNCAPRKDVLGSRANNEGEGLVVGMLDNGIKVVAVNSGYSLSFLRDRLVKLYKANVDDGGSQFRSRDNFPRIVAAILDAHFNSDHSFNGVLGQILIPEECIPPIPYACVGYVDSFGNMKTTIRDEDEILTNLSPSQKILVKVGDVEKVAYVSSGSFNVKHGEIAFSRGSSGGRKRFWEIFERGGSAWHTYRKPRPGTKIEVSAWTE